MLKLLISFSCLTRTALISETEICVKSSRKESYVTANTATHNLHLIFRKPLKSSWKTTGLLSMEMKKMYHQIRVYERQHINVYADQKAPELDHS